LLLSDRRRKIRFRAVLFLVLSKPRDAQERAMRNAITTAATIRNVFANGQDAAIGTANDKRYGSRSHLKSAASHSGRAQRGFLASSAFFNAAAECRRGLRGLRAAWLQTAARLPIAAESIGQAMFGMAMRRPVAPRVAVRVAIR
jgi:hypothetical protein